MCGVFIVGAIAVSYCSIYENMSWYHTKIQINIGKNVKKLDGEYTYKALYQARFPYYVQNNQNS